MPCCNTLEAPKTFRIKLNGTQGVISVNGPKFMNWTQGTGGGGAIDLVILQVVDFKDAVLLLHNHFSSCFVQRSSPNKSHPVKQILKLPQKDDKKTAAGYAIPHKQTVYSRRTYKKSLIKSKKLYADIRGNAVFLVLGKKREWSELN